MTALFFLACLVAWQSTDLEGMLSLMGEDGPVQMANAFLLGLASLALLAQMQNGFRFFLSSGFMVALMCIRELDLDHAFTSESVLAIRFYSFPSVPLIQKLVVAPIVLAIGVFVLDYVRRYGGIALKGLQARRAEAWSVANVVLLLGYSVIIDGLARKLHGMFGIDLPPVTARHLLTGLEEGMEMAIPAIILWALLQWTVAHAGEVSTSRSPRAAQADGE